VVAFQRSDAPVAVAVHRGQRVGAGAYVVGILAGELALSAHLVLTELRQGAVVVDPLESGTIARAVALHAHGKVHVVHARGARA